MSSFGYEILATPITDIEPNAEVKRAMNEINKAKRLRVAASDAGEATKIKAIKEAEAEASRTEIQAKASAEAMHLSGVGIARQRQAIMEGLRESVNAWGTEVDDVPPNQVTSRPTDVIVARCSCRSMSACSSCPTNAVVPSLTPLDPRVPPLRCST